MDDSGLIRRRRLQARGGPGGWEGVGTRGGARQEAGELDAGVGLQAPSHGLGKLPGGTRWPRPAALGTLPSGSAPGTQGSDGGACSLQRSLESSPGAPDLQRR